MAKPKGVRSPNYPTVSLREAVSRVQALYKKEHNHPADREVIAKAIGYTTLNGASASVISALAKYGLLEPAGDGYRVSTEAMEILMLSKDDPDRIRAIQKVAFLPSLFTELFATFGEQLPSDTNLRMHLIKRGFNPTTVSGVIRSYRDTMQYVNEETGGFPTENSPEAAIESLQTPATNVANPPVTRLPTDLQERANGAVEYAFPITADSSIARVIFSNPVTEETLAELLAYLNVTLQRLMKKSQTQESHPQNQQVPDEVDS